MKLSSNIPSKHFPLGILILIDLIVAAILFIIFVLKPNNIDFIKWQRPELVWLMLISPLATLLYLTNTFWKRKALSAWSETSADEVWETNHSFGRVDFNRSFTRFLWLKLGLIFLIFSLLNPRSGGELVESTSEGIELVVALDISPSMMAEDVTPNRLSAAKLTVKNILNQLGGDLVGLVIFSGHAYTQMPLSNDYGSAVTYVDAADPKLLDEPGTSISEAIDESLTLFSEETISSKVIILITDGEDHEGAIEASLISAKEKDVKISTVAMGSQSGAPIPDLYNPDKYKKDKTGQTVISKTNRDILKQISENSGGEFFDLKSGSMNEVRSISRYIEKEQTTEIGTFSYVNLSPRFRYPLIISILCFLLYMVYREKNTSWF